MIIIAQSRNIVGDIEGNAQRVIEAVIEARDRHKAHLIVFPELVITGYPPEDLLLRPQFHRRAQKALELAANEFVGIDVILGHTELRDDNLFNVASFYRHGKRLACWTKRCLPNYSVFDEKRYFKAGDNCVGDVVQSHGINITCLICEDIWEDAPIQTVRQSGADLLLTVNASPFHRSKQLQRRELLQQRVAEAGCPVVYVHCVGGQDEIVFDGGSMAFNASGEVVMQAPFFKEGLFPLEVHKDAQGISITSAICEEIPSEESLIYDALVLGVRDYVYRNGFKGAIVGASGGIDSALTLAIAVDALGAEAVEAIAMPSRFSAEESAQYAKEQATLLGCRYRELTIEPVFEAFLETLKPEFQDVPVDTTEENLQARVRGTLLMALSNKFGKMVLTTGNKSEMAVGYATLYGDMAGGFAVLKDVFKTWVYRLANYRNQLGLVIPQSVIERAPTAELAHGQFDQDTLPPYDILDAILEAYVERDEGLRDIVAKGYARGQVEFVLRCVDRNEYKRRQAPPGVRVTGRAFGRDRRYPITSTYRW